MALNIDWFRDSVLTDFAILADFVTHSEAQLQESHHTMRSVIGGEFKLPPDLSVDDEQFLLADHFGDLDDCDRRDKFEFAGMLRFSIILMTFTLVESSLSRIAREITRRKQLDLDLEDLQAKDLVSRFRKFWMKVAKLPWWEDDTNWNLLKDVEQLRNCIAHRNGILRNNEKRVHQLMQRNVGVRLLNSNESLDSDRPGSVFVEERFCREIIDRFVTLVRQVFDRAGCFGPAQVSVISSHVFWLRFFKDAFDFLTHKRWPTII